MTIFAPSSCAKGRHLHVKMLHGHQTYEHVWHAMQAFTEERTDSTDDTLWVLEHESVYTQGQAGKSEHLIAPGNIPVVQVDRGGQVTYHGPGQLVIYLMIDINRLGIGPRELVSTIEHAIVQTLASYDLTAEARKDAPGVYINDAKIASLGLRIRKGKSFHGLSLNVDMDLEPFKRINPCGYKDLEMIQLTDFHDEEVVEQVAGRLVNEIQNAFGYSDINMEYAQAI
jgi:lipoyl(octanoyl) transferase